MARFGRAPAHQVLAAQLSFCSSEQHWVGQKGGLEPRDYLSAAPVAADHEGISEAARPSDIDSVIGHAGTLAEDARLLAHNFAGSRTKT